ncbi:hypothetical protein ACFLZT_02970 [Thermodesulfobacteriota bacterium]
MKKIFAILVLILFYIVVPPSYSADRGMSGTYNPRTGDATLDSTLGNLNIQTQGKNLSDFISNLSLSYKIPKIEIENLLFKVKMPPADVYMAVGLAKISNKPVDEVVNEYKTNKGKGWGVIAKQLGIKPGSRDFKTLKNGGALQLDKVKGKGKSKNEKKSEKKKKNKNK